MTTHNNTLWYVLAVGVEKKNDTMTDPEYNPMSVPLGTLTAGRTPHPQCNVLNTWSGVFRGFCATRVRHVSSQEQFCTGGKKNTTSLDAQLTILHSLSNMSVVSRQNKP